MDSSCSLLGWWTEASNTEDMPSNCLLKKDCMNHFLKTDEKTAPPIISVIVNIVSASDSPTKIQKTQESSVHTNLSLNQINSATKNAVVLDEYSDEDGELADQEATSDLMPVIVVMIAEEYLMETTLEFVVNIFVMTN